jgi:hypothetical protein
MVVSAFTFVRPGSPPATNPVQAFFQGLRDEPGEQQLMLEAFRCVTCGRVELYAGAGTPATEGATASTEGRLTRDRGMAIPRV